MQKSMMDKLFEWTKEGLLTSAQKSAIEAYEAESTVPDERPSTAGKRYGEVLAYVGGLVVLSGMYTLLDDFWTRMSVLVQVTLLVFLTGGFYAIGYYLLNNKSTLAIRRLAVFLTTVAVMSTLGTVYYTLESAVGLQSEVAWTTSFFVEMGMAFFVCRRLDSFADAFSRGSSVLLQYGAAVSGTLGQIWLLVEVLKIESSLGFLTASIVGTVVSGLAWRFRSTAVVHSIVYGFVLMAAWSSVFRLNGDLVDYGMMTWPLSLIWFGLCAKNWLRPNGVGLMMSSAVLPVSAILIGLEWELVGSSLLLTTGVLLIGFSTKEFNMRVFTSGALCVLFASPALMFQLFDDFLPTSILLILSGLILLGAGLYLNRIRREIIQEVSNESQ